jgi:hypothetical protein
MSELRLSLLALGVGFLLGLAAWEWWRRREAAAAARREPVTTSGTVAPPGEAADEWLAAAPTLDACEPRSGVR